MTRRPGVSTPAPSRPARLRRVVLAVLITCAAAQPARAQPATEPFVGRPLADVLRVLQARGLRLVYSSELVTPDMRVRSTSPTASDREQLLAILHPHGLTAEAGPGGILQIVRRSRPARTRTRATATPPSGGLEETPTRDDAPAVYRERVTVRADSHANRDARRSTERRLASSELRVLGSSAADDPVRSVQVLPGVAGGDDFRSEFSVRGSAYRHAGIVVDGVSAPWLRHAASGRGDTGTLTMLRGDLIQDATLRVGAYPLVDGGQLGPQLHLTLREGSRVKRQMHLLASSTVTTATAEGPIGSSARGSWLVGGRKSHVSWPIGHSETDQTIFGFGDVQSKIAFDVRPMQQITASLVAGLTNVEHDDARPLSLGDGLNRAALLSVAWRSGLGARTVVTQRVSTVAETFRNTDDSLQTVNRGSNRALAYRLDLVRAWRGNSVESGAQVRRLRGSRRGSMRPVPTLASPAADVDASWLERSGYISLRRDVRADVTLTAGARLSDSTLVDRRALDRWVQAEWAPAVGWLVHGSAGVAHQFPELDHTDGWTDEGSLRAERALNADIGLGHQLSARTRWDVTVFARRERDGLREATPRLWLFDPVNGASGAGRFENALTGSAHGVELMIERRGDARFTGWAGYAYGVATSTDEWRRETFASDFDQRHAVNAAGVVALPWSARAAATFRGGTNFPITGYLASRGDRLFLGDRRNEVRLAGYARLDLRLEKPIATGGRVFTVFGEVMNVLNRVNRGPAYGVVLPDTGEAVGFTERLFPRLVTAGVRVAF